MCKTVQMARKGLVFDVPVGYRNLKDYASVMRLNLRMMQLNPAKPLHVQEISRYQAEVERLETAGL